MKARILNNQEVKLYTDDFFDKYPHLVNDWDVIDINEDQVVFIKNCIFPKYINNEFVDAYIETTEVPIQLSRMKFKMQIRRSTSYNYDSIKDYILNIPISEVFTQDMKEDIIDRLEDCTHFERYSPDLIMIAQMLNVTEEQLDEIFINGNLIE